MRLTRFAAIFALTLTTLSLQPAAAAAQAQQRTGWRNRGPGARAPTGRGVHPDRRRDPARSRGGPEAVPAVPAAHPAAGSEPAGQPRLSAALPGAGGVPGPAPRSRRTIRATSSPNTTANYGDSRNRMTAQDRAVEMWRNAIEGFTIGVVMLAIASGPVIWLIKTLIEHRRWSRLSKIQTEVHNKLLDRFTPTRTCWPTSRRRRASASSNRRRSRWSRRAPSPRRSAASCGRRRRARSLTVLGIGVIARVAEHARRSRRAAGRASAS